jgi:hypothetical protein
MNALLRFKMVIALFLLFVALASALTYALNNADSVQKPVISAKISKAESTPKWLPSWMPKSWCVVLLHRFAQKKLNFNFDQPLDELSESINEITWVDSVKRISRDYQGNFSVDVDIKTPLCYVSDKKLYIDKNRDFMFPLTDRNHHILKNGETIPVVDTTKIKNNSTSKSEMSVWLQNLVDFIVKWNNNDVVSERFDLKLIKMVPYRTRNYSDCLFTIQLFDKKEQKQTRVEWGSSKNENALESVTGDQKWRDLENAVKRGGHNSSIDLRYKVSAGTL